MKKIIMLIIAFVLLTTFAYAAEMTNAKAKTNLQISRAPATRDEIALQTTTGTFFCDYAGDVSGSYPGGGPLPRLASQINKFCDLRKQFSITSQQEGSNSYDVYCCFKK